MLPKQRDSPKISSTVGTTMGHWGSVKQAAPPTTHHHQLTPTKVVLRPHHCHFCHSLAIPQHVCRSCDNEKCVCDWVCDWVGYVNDFSLLPKYIFINSDRAFVEPAAFDTAGKVDKNVLLLGKSSSWKEYTRLFGAKCPSLFGGHDLSMQLEYWCWNNKDTQFGVYRFFGHEKLPKTTGPTTGPSMPY